jgi:hypothetical protein
VKAEAEARLAEAEQRLRQLRATDLASDCDHLNEELRGPEAQIFQLQVELSKMTKERDQVRQQVASIQRSVFWRLTWPIRRLHKFATKARNALSKEHFL